MAFFGFGRSKGVYNLCSTLVGRGPRFFECPDKTTSYIALSEICKPSRSSSSDLGRALGRLLVAENSRLQEVDIKTITAITVSKGGFVGNLPRLIATISPAPAGVEKMHREDHVALLRDQVVAEFGFREGRLDLIEEGWSGRLIASNDGAARRFALLQDKSLPGEAVFPASIRTVRFDPSALAVLTERMWVFLLPRESYANLSSGLGQLGVGAPQQCADVYSKARERDDDRTIWTVAGVDRSWKHYGDFRLGLEDGAVPLFDLSRWLRELVNGRNKP